MSDIRAVINRAASAAMRSSLESDQRGDIAFVTARVRDAVTEAVLREVLNRLNADRIWPEREIVKSMLASLSAPEAAPNCEHCGQSPCTGDCTCAWRPDDTLGVWATTCGQQYAVESERPTLAGMRFCCYCGKRLLEAAPEAAPAPATERKCPACYGVGVITDGHHGHYGSPCVTCGGTGHVG